MEKDKSQKIKGYWEAMAISVFNKDLATVRRTMHALHALGVSWSKKSDHLALDYDEYWNGTWYTYTNEGYPCFSGDNFGNMESVYGATTTDYMGGFRFTRNGGVDYQWFFFDYHYNGGADYFDQITTGGDDSSRILLMSPEDGSVVGNSVDYYLQVWLSEADVARGVGVRVKLHNIDKNGLNYLFNFPSDNDFILYDEYVTEAGVFTFSDTRTLDDGNYRLEASLIGSAGTLFGAPILTGCNIGGWLGDVLCVSASTQFVVNEPTLLGSLSTDLWNNWNNLATSSSATSTSALISSCNPFSGSASTLFFNTDFSVFLCLNFLFVPDSSNLMNNLNAVWDQVIHNFPVGYVTDFIEIVSTTTMSSLTVIDTEVPVGIPGAGTPIRLDLAHSLDWVLYDTADQFSTGSTSTSTTFYEITVVYWKYIIWILTIFYILNRILGSFIIPQPFQEMSGDKNVSDESYRLKEKLYEMSKRK